MTAESTIKRSWGKNKKVSCLNGQKNISRSNAHARYKSWEFELRRLAEEHMKGKPINDQLYSDAVEVRRQFLEIYPSVREYGETLSGEPRQDHDDLLRFMAQEQIEKVQEMQAQGITGASSQSEESAAYRGPFSTHTASLPHYSGLPWDYARPG